MANEIRNELLLILNISKNGMKKTDLNELVERIELDIKDQLKELEYKQQRLNENLELVKYVKEEMEKRN